MKIVSSKTLFIRQTDEQTYICIALAPVGARNKK